MQFPISIRLHRSFVWVAGLMFAHAIAAVAISLPSWEAWLKSLLLIGLAGSAWHSQKLWIPKIRELRLFKDGRVECALAGSAFFLPAELLPGMTVHPWLALIRLKVDSTTITIPVFPDSAAPENFRRLRVWLRWRAALSASGNTV